MTATSHVLVMMVYAFLVGAVGGALVKDTPSAQVRAGAKIAVSLLAGALVLGWVLFAFPI